MSRPSTTGHTVLGMRAVWATLWLAAVASLVGIAPGVARATHERATLITWVPTTGNTVEFTIQGAWRRDAYGNGSGLNRCVTATNPPVNGSCTGTGGFAGVGDIIHETQGSSGGTTFDFGDGSATFGVTIGGQKALLYVVTSVDPTNNWLFGLALDHTSLPTIDTAITKTYSSSAQRTAFIQDCCRISNTAGGNQHINNPDGNYRIETTVTPGGTNRPPVSTMPPIVLCPKNGLCAFSVPVSDPDGDVVTFRLSTPTEASGSATGFDQPGPPDAPNAAAINSTFGTYTWDTTGATVGGATSNTYYSTQVTLEDRDSGNAVKSKIAVDFLIQLVTQGAGVPPVFDHPPTPQCDSTINVNPGATASFTVQASDSDFGQTVTLNAVGLPAGATLTPPLPTAGNPVSTMFSWPTGGGDAGSTHVMTFTATDTASQQSQCSITIQVAQCQSNADCNDGNACTTDTCDPMHPNANTGGCVSGPVVCDACQTCNMLIGCFGPVCTPTQTATHTVTGTPPSTSTVTNTPTPSDTPTQTQTPTPFCGDGNLDPGEMCDDGNMEPNDGCDPPSCTPSTACSLLYSGTEHFVGGCGTPSNDSIQSALNGAADGDTITVCPGTYTQPVLVDKQVRIRAVPGGGVIVHTAGTAFDVRRSGVHIEGLTIQSDSGSGVAANTICPLGQPSCPSPGQGTNLTITGNTIVNSPIGIGWQRRIDCVQITNNAMTGNASHIELLQQEGQPAVLVSIVNNVISGGGQAGAAVSLSGLGVIVAANRIETSANAGIMLANVPGGGATQVIENNIADNLGDGITVKPGADGTAIHDNNITHNATGLGNESTSGTLDATLNWWASQTGPSGLFSGSGDSIVNRSSGATEFIEFLCKPFPQGFPSVGGECGTETPELRQLVPGRNPDLDPFGRYVAFESTTNIDVDPATALSNADASQEVFLLNRRPKRRKLAGVCVGGMQSCDFDNLSTCATCNGPRQCPGDESADPIVLNGECVLVTQITDGAPTQQSGKPRLNGFAKNVTYASNNDQIGSNADGSLEVMSWSRRAFERNTAPLIAKTNGAPPDSYDGPSPSLSNRFIYVESNANPTGENADANTEIFALKTRNDTWIQVTHTLPPIENRRPSTIDGRRAVFDSTGDLVGTNTDGNRELFIVRVKASGLEITQITDTLAPVDNRSGSIDSHNAVVAFSSNGDFVGQNADANREIFTWARRTGAFAQITQSVDGENVNPVVNPSKRFIVFESTADLTTSGATNRRVFHFDRTRGKLTLLSRSRFGTNQVPRISKKRFVVWESTADLTGSNPFGEWVIYLFDRKKD